MTVPNDWLKITLAMYKFTKDARIWWKTMTSAHGIDSMSWDTFKELFSEKYFPITKKRELRIDLLKQGDMTVAEYENEFTSLSPFATEVVRDENEKTWKFVHGLHHSIRPSVAAFELGVYSEAVTKALIVEAEANDWQTKSEGVFSERQKEKRHKSNVSSSQGQQMVRSAPIISVSIGSHQIKIVCYHCRQAGHFRPECPQGRPRSNVCFKCGELDHRKKDCPLRGGSVIDNVGFQQGSQSSRPTRGATPSASFHQSGFCGGG
ncbi:uncharacterized protein LOC132313935 [Cornus florida]|uniref:uncharacterized protein LOC132313935 n=1 Tax=Cornus florida TaxID=4283 RepID=UPI002898FABE|nr:uncharacterized protein LOC132313935 [Cornus florida]